MCALTHTTNAHLTSPSWQTGKDKNKLNIIMDHKGHYTTFKLLVLFFLQGAKKDRLIHLKVSPSFHMMAFLFFLFVFCQCYFFQISGASVDETLVGEVILSVLRVTVNKPALYTCLAFNRHSAGANTVKATARVTVTGGDVIS